MAIHHSLCGMILNAKIPPDMLKQSASVARQLFGIVSAISFRPFSKHDLPTGLGAIAFRKR
jgi:hypothetical protein